MAKAKLNYSQHLEFISLGTFLAVEYEHEKHLQPTCEGIGRESGLYGTIIPFLKDLSE